MTTRRHTPEHDRWHRRVEGQLRDAIMQHPEWFAFKNDAMRKTAINSMAKRIVGEIVACGQNGPQTGAGGVNLPASGANGCACRVQPDGGGVGLYASPPVAEPGGPRCPHCGAVGTDYCEQVRCEWDEWGNDDP